MERKVISTPQAPAAIGPYSQAIKLGNLVFCSGQIALDPLTGEMTGTSVAQQTRRVMENLKAVLEAAGSSMDRVVKTTIYLDNMNEFATVNEIYAEYFGDEPPARATIDVENLPKGALVEIDAIADAG